LPKTAAIIIVGNEILSGKVMDSNSHFLASELRALGIDVKRIIVIPDDVSEIGKEVYESSSKYDYVFTAGGIGPTLDDLTVEGIAHGFGAPLIKSPQMERIILTRCGERPPQGSALKMALIPEGTELIFNKEMRFPIMVFKNIYIFPGIPKFLREKFNLIKDRFRTEPFHIKKIFINEDECFVSDYLVETSKKYPDVSIGSYPIVEGTGYKVSIILESQREDSLEGAFRDLVGRLPKEIVVSMSD